ncbi:MAG TPA: EAL domain-containing protein [Burkholderiaceae bacterium]|nr:EAL domain-containing protein [Burkholderiaceae bacterium]
MSQFSFLPIGPARRQAWAMAFAGAVVPSLLCCALGSYAVWRSRTQYEQRAELTSQNLASALERSVSADIEKVDVVLNAVVADLEAQLAGGELDLRLADRQIDTLTASRPELEGLRVTDAQGMAILGQQIRGRPPIDFSDREWFRVQRDRPDANLLMSGPLVSKIHGGSILSFSRRYRHADGRFAGAVTAAVPLSYLAKGLSTVDIGPHGIVALRTADLGMITRHPPTQLVRASAIGSKNVSPELRALVESGQTHATFHAKATADGIERTTTFRRLAVAPIIVIVGLGSEDYLADWQSESRTVVVFCLTVIAVFGFGTLMLLRAMAQNRASLERIDLLAKVFEHSGEAIVVTDRHGRIVEVNPAFVRRMGYRPEEVLGTNARLLLSPTTAPQQTEAIEAALRDQGGWRGELTERAKDGREFPAWVTVSTLLDAAGEVSHVIGNSIELTDLKQAEAQIRHLAHHDTLTRLPNRVLLQARLEQAMAAARRDGDELAMLFIDMDRFKTINDTLGHPVGDGLLVEVGRRLQGIVRESDIVARLGGDEFVLVLTGVERQGARAAATVASKVLAALGQPYDVAGHELHSTPSIGIGVFPTDGDAADALMKCADTAMYHAKAAGRNNFQFFTHEMKQASAERLALDNGLRGAIARRELLLHYQPQVDLAGERVVGLEALLRWRHPELGLIPPLKFIAIAEVTGQIEAIGQWVIEEALAQVARWRASLDARLRVAVNVSAQQLRGDGFVEQVAVALQRHALPGSALELEVTESTAMRDPARTAEQLLNLRALGVAIAIDDFGTGYSSMAHLKQLPLSSLKLDRSFVMDIERDANDAAISQATIQLAHSLGLAVIAEGVETREQLEFLRALRCDVAQGYLIAKPLPADECEAFLRRALRRDEAAVLPV